MTSSSWLHSRSKEPPQNPGQFSRIGLPQVEDELQRLRQRWLREDQRADAASALLGEQAAATLDLFDRLQLNAVAAACRGCRSLSAAGRRLFAQSRLRKSSSNDADRLRKYFAGLGLQWNDIVALEASAERLESPQPHSRPAP